MIDRPQRMVHPTAPGALLKAAAMPRPARAAVTDVGYLKLVRECPCLCCGLDPAGEAAHVRYASAAYGKASGLSKRPEDRFAVSLCASCHRTARHAQHHHGERQWWEALGINPLLTCARLSACRGDLVAMRAVIFLTISQRGE